MQSIAFTKRIKGYVGTNLFKAKCSLVINQAHNKCLWAIFIYCTFQFLNHQVEFYELRYGKFMLILINRKQIARGIGQLELPIYLKS